jgi:hypothetical protein
MPLTSAQKAADARLRRVYKKTLADKEREIAEQGGGCAICGRPWPEFDLYQDHDHACCKRPKGKKGNTATFCGKCNRGWLCYLCNKWAIGGLEFMAKVNIPAARAIKYLLFWHEEIVKRGGYEPKEETKRKSRYKKKGFRSCHPEDQENGSALDQSEPCPGSVA